MQDRRTFGERLQAAMGTIKLIEIERCTGVPSGNLSLMIRGERYPSAKSLRALCDTLPMLDFDTCWVQIGIEQSMPGEKREEVHAL